MKKILALVLATIMIVSLLAGCGAPAGKPAEGGSAGAGIDKPAEKKRIALVCDVAGTQVFVLSMIDGLNAAAEKFGFEKTVVECADSAAYEDAIRAVVEEGYDLVVVGGWQGGEALGKIAKEMPDKAHYALIDSEVDAENVKCIFYREQEGAYLVGMIAASVMDKDQHKYGAVHVNQGPGSWKWRYGFQEGVKKIDPEATFTFNYTGSFNDPAKAKEFALQQYAAGARFINAAAAGGDIGVFEAALEKKFCTSGQDVDLTNPDNPYIVTSQIKDTKATMEYLCDLFMNNKWAPGNEEWGISEGVIGAVYVTHESKNPMSEKLSPEALEAVKQAAEDIRSGKLNLKEMPAEEDYK